jgi:MYXO-CTERM domain-containing protein
MRRALGGLILLTAASALLGVVAVPAEAGAYVRSRVPGGNACLYWGKRTIPWYLNEAGSAHVDDDSDRHAAIASFQAWNDPACSDVSFELVGTTSRRDIGFVEGANDNINLVVWREALCSDVVPQSDPCWQCFDRGGPCCPTAHGCWGHTAGAIAVTTTTFHRSSGLLVDADIELNGARYHFTTSDGPPCEERHAAPICTTDGDCAAGRVCLRERCRTEGCVHTDIANTLTHEVGHVLGLDHTPVRDATMYASAPLGELQKRTLHEDDVQGLCDIYPEGGPTLTCLADVIVISPLAQVDDTPRWWQCASAGGEGRGGFLVLLLLGVAAILARRRPLRRPHAAKSRGVCLRPVRKRDVGAGRRGVRRDAAFALPLLLGAALTWGDAPGDLERWLAAGEVVAVVKARDEPTPCGASGRPAVQQTVVEDGLMGGLTPGPLEILLVPGEGEALPAGVVALAVIRPVTAEDGVGCATVPGHVLHEAAPGLAVSPAERASWTAYLDAARALPAGGSALHEARVDLWVDALAAEAKSLRRHAASSLSETVRAGALPAASLQRLLDLAVGPDRPLAGRLLALEVAGAALAPAALGRLLTDPKGEVAEAAARIVLDRAADADGGSWLARATPSLDAAWRERRAEPTDVESLLQRTALAAALAATGDRRGRPFLLGALDHPDVRIRSLAAGGLGRLAAAGDREVGAVLDRRLLVESAPEVRSTLEAALVAAKSGEGGDPAVAEGAVSGVRMILVVLGLVALLGMALLPMRVGRARPPAGMSIR